MRTFKVMIKKITTLGDFCKSFFSLLIFHQLLFYFVIFFASHSYLPSLFKKLWWGEFFVKRLTQVGLFVLALQYTYYFRVSSINFLILRLKLKSRGAIILNCFWIMKCKYNNDTIRTNSFSGTRVEPLIHFDKTINGLMKGECSSILHSR